MTEADLNDVYSKTCGMITEASTQPLDRSIQQVITTVTEAIGNATPDTMEATSSSRRPRSYNAAQDSRNAKRLKASALGNVVIGNRNEKSGALDDITPT